MPSRMKQEAPVLDPDFVVADADYFRSRAQHCHLLARQAESKDAEQILERLAQAFEQRALEMADKP